LAPKAPAIVKKKLKKEIRGSLLWNKGTLSQNEIRLKLTMFIYKINLCSI